MIGEPPMRSLSENTTYQTVLIFALEIYNFKKRTNAADDGSSIRNYRILKKNKKTSRFVFKRNLESSEIKSIISKKVKDQLKEQGEYQSAVVRIIAFLVSQV